MKKIVKFILMGAVIVLASCSKNDVYDYPPKASFENSSFRMAKGSEFIIKVLLDVPVENETSIPLTIVGGTEGVDFNLGSPEITIPEGKRTGEMHVSIPEDITESKNVRVSLGSLPAGFVAGRFPTAILEITTDPIAIISFSKSNISMGGEFTEVSAVLYDLEGSRYSVPVDTRIKVKATEASSAVLGTHFKFKDDQDYIFVAAGKDVGKVTIQNLGYEPDKDKIEIVSANENIFRSGQTPSTTVVIKPGYLGEWIGAGYYNLDDFIANNSWAAGEDDPIWDYYRDHGDNNRIVISETTDKEGTLHVELPGTLKYYLRDCTWKEIGTSMVVFGMQDRVMAPRLELSEANFAFDPIKEDIKPASINLVVRNVGTIKNALILVVGWDGGYDVEQSSIGGPFWSDLTFVFKRAPEDPE